jgi:hypothetical protein
LHTPTNRSTKKKAARKPTADERKLLGPKSATLKYDARMIRAAEIALRRAHPKTTWHCWRSVKDALLAANLVSSRPTSPWAKQAGDELCRKFGFARLDLQDPFRAPIGAVVVYGGNDAGHVELRTTDGFVSDFVSPTPYPRPLIGIYVKRPESTGGA